MAGCSRRGAARGRAHRLEAARLSLSAHRKDADRVTIGERRYPTANMNGS